MTGTNANSERLNEDPTTFCFPCPPNTGCDKNTTIETIKGAPGFWRASLQTQTFYECDRSVGVCLGGVSCAKGHNGVRCEVCDDTNKYFAQSEGECTTCPKFSRIGIVAGIFTGIFLCVFIIKYIARQYREIEQFFLKTLSALTAIGIQAKFKIFISFCQVVVTIQPIYGVRMHSAFTSWFSLFDIFNFGLEETFGIPGSCFGSMKARLLIGAGWPYALALFMISGIFIYTFTINLRRLERKDALARFFFLSLRGVIFIFYLVLPSVSRQIFDARHASRLTQMTLGMILAVT